MSTAPDPLPGLEPPEPAAQAPLVEVPPLKMTAAEVKEALRKRHPAFQQGIPGEWTCLEEWRDIDLLAVSAWSGARLVGYEVKVSRSDYRRELLKPSKRAKAVAGCHEFYFAVPAGLLKRDEIAFDEPEWKPGDFARESCPGIPTFGPPSGRRRSDAVGRYGGRCCDWHTRAIRGFTIEVPAVTTTERYRGEYVRCPTCRGKGYLEKSRVERDAPTLWVPRDVGLIEITSRGTRVVRPAPKRKPEKPLIPRELRDLARWVSLRPDPRHRKDAA